MKVTSYSEARANLARVLDGVTDDSEEVVVHRKGHDPAVIISLREYEALQETAHLLRSPTNARRLMESIERLEDGRGVVREPVEVEE